MKHLLLLFAALTTLAACTDPITVGSDILQDDIAAVGQINNLPISARVVKDDPIRFFNAERGGFLSYYSFGQSKDDVFGNWKHSMVLRPGLPASRVNDEVITTRPVFVLEPGVTVDSVVLILPIDTFQGIYGPASSFNVQLLELTEDFPLDADVYTDYPRPSTGRNLFEGSAIPVTKNATPLYDTIYSNRRDSLPHIRIKLDQAFVDAVNQLDTSDFVTDSVFREFFPGVLLETTSDDHDGFVTIRPLPSQGGFAEQSGFYFFYEDPAEGDDGSFYRVPLNAWLPRYEHDYSGSLAGQLLQDSSSDDRLLIGGAATVLTAVEFNSITELRNTLINHAEVIYYRDSVDGYSYEAYPPSTLIGAFYRNSNGDLSPILDRRIDAPLTNLAVRRFLGGYEELVEDEAFYRNRLSAHMQGIVDLDFTEPIIYLRNIPMNRTNTGDIPLNHAAARVIVRGPGASTRPMKSTVTFTRTN